MPLTLIIDGSFIVFFSLVLVSIVDKLVFAVLLQVV